MPENDLIEHNGSMVAKGWPARIEAAQLETHYIIGGKAHPRVRYGDEDADWGEGACGDCAVAKGQLHVPGCDIERCPACGGQMISCPCPRGGEQ